MYNTCTYNTYNSYDKGTILALGETSVGYTRTLCYHLHNFSVKLNVLNKIYFKKFAKSNIYIVCIQVWIGRRYEKAQMVVIIVVRLHKTLKVLIFFLSLSVI